MMNATLGSASTIGGTVSPIPTNGRDDIITRIPLVVKSGGVGVPTIEGCSLMRPDSSAWKMLFEALQCSI